jgi:hypothetical protein
MDDNRFAKLAKNGKLNTLRPSGQPPKVGAKIGHQRYRRTDIKYKTWSYKKMKNKKTS